MKTIYFENSNIIGFEVATANDVIKAQELGLYICNKDEDYFDYYVTEQDEDGNETEREATKDERMERMIKALREGQQLYATFGFDDCGMKAVKNSATILASNFRVGQTVYTMRDNKIVSGTILYMSLSISENENKFYLDYRSKYLIEELYSFCARKAGINKNVLSLQSEEFDNVTALIHNSIHGNSVVVSFDGDKEARYMSEIFATKEELINRLLNE
nr:MAG TPA: hypothetical protein [Caudoviricetes sp.]